MKAGNLVIALLFLVPLVVAAAPLSVISDDLHAGVSRDCGDGKTFTKLGVKWNAFPVSYYVQAPSTHFAAAIERAFATYEALEHPAGPIPMFAVGSPGAKIEVTFAAIDGRLGTLARTQIWYNTLTKAIVEVNIVFDSAEAWDVLGPIACESQGEFIDVEAVAAHELGHGVGLGHSSSSSALTMYPFYGLGATKQRTLATGDVKGVSSLYK